MFVVVSCFGFALQSVVRNGLTTTSQAGSSYALSQAAARIRLAASWPNALPKAAITMAAEAVSSKAPIRSWSIRSAFSLLVACFGFPLIGIVAHHSLRVARVLSRRARCAKLPARPRPRRKCIGSTPPRSNRPSVCRRRRIRRRAH